MVTPTKIHKISRKEEESLAERQNECKFASITFLQDYRIMMIIKTLYRIAALMVCLIYSLSLTAIPTCRVVHYDENNGLSHWRVTQMLQDYGGIIWFATWNGLNRFDGYEFKCFKVSQEGNCLKTDDRIRNIWLSEEGDIYCKSDEGYYGFDPQSCTFYDIEGEDNETLYNKLLTRYKGFWLDNLANGDLHHTDANGYQWTLTHGGKLYCQSSETQEQTAYPLNVPMKELRFGYSDKQGNLWIIFTGGVYKMVFTDNSIEHLPQEHTIHVRSTFVDHNRRYWVTGRDDNSVRLFSADNQLLGYLGSDGRLHKQYTPFAASIYCITQSSTGVIWMGSKPGGLFRLQEESDGQFRITRFLHDPNEAYSLSHNDVYDIKEDTHSRLWIATLGGGVNCLTNPEAEHPRFIHKGNELQGYPTPLCKKVRYLHLTNEGVMLVATTEGLLTARLPDDDRYDQMHFRHHVKQPNTPTSLSCSATMDILQDSHGNVFVSTENGGICQVTNKDLLADTLHFRHFNTSNGLPSDVVLSMTEHEGSIWIVCTNQICIINPYEEIISSFDSNFFQRYYRFSEARPTQLPDGRWIFGLHDGAFTLSTQRLRKSDYVPPIILTSVTKQGETTELGILRHDTLVIQPHERNLTVRFAAIDYTNAGLINYTFRLARAGSGTWNNLGKNRATTLLDVKPGEYILEISSTNADGIWVDNTLKTTIIVVPTFWETGWAILLYILIGLLILGAILYTFAYIRRIKRQQRETLESYLTLLNKPEKQNAETTVTTTEKEITAQLTTSNDEDDLFMRRVMAFIEEHMGNPDINVGDMAETLATSRSSLNRKLKSTLGVTPLDLLREARIKRACQLLESSELNISEIAYHCGFSDPKYFSRCFKQSMGVSPTEYKNR